MNRRIEQFLAVYEEKNIHKAAEVLGISQPALTVSLKNLEEALGAKLFTRSVKGMSPTPAAGVLYRFGMTLHQCGRFVDEEIQGLSGGITGRLRVGAGVAWATTVLPDVMNRMHEKFPALSIDLITGVGDQLATRLIDGELDVVVAAGSVQSLASPEFHCEPMINLPMKIVADPKSKLAQQSVVSPEQLASVKWVSFYEDESMVQFSNHFLALHGLPPAKFVMRTNSPTSLTSFLKKTEFVAILIAPLAGSTTMASGLIQLKSSVALWELPVAIYYRKIVEGSETIASFRKLTKSAMEQFRE
ncbi:LysR family transcriptional regulator [uncultured Ruegeria sp.]|uniref:LysR family transcriptional regulator n=1 Tax=uncultured Ruegeria sp. TaxID=259304 RepID=UPI002601EFBE|nr:LysR family transcriptional regulator [uncultured Ruegeria sp.]